MSLSRPYARLLHIAFEGAWRADGDDPHRCAECGLRVWTSTHRGAYGGMDALTWHRRYVTSRLGPDASPLAKMWARAVERADERERARQRGDKAGYVTAQVVRP
jgi:hypothetical protein